MSLDRELPNAAEAERAALGCVLWAAEALDRVAPIVTAADFYREPHRMIFAAMQGLSEASKPIDLLTVKDELARRGELDRCGGTAYVSSLMDGVPNIANVEHYAETVREKSRLRLLVTEGNRLLTTALAAEESSAEIAARSSLALSDLSLSRRGEAESLDVAMRKAVSEIERRAMTREHVTGVPFGMPQLDALTLGQPKSVVNSCGARTAVGKTAFGISSALHNARAGRRVLFVELDMSPGMVNERLLANAAGVRYKRIQSGQFLQADDWDRIARAGAELAALKDLLRFDYVTHDLGALTALIRREARHGLDLVIIDHVGHVDGVKADRRDLEIGKVSRRMIDLAGETGAAVSLLVQLKREAASRAPVISDLAECSKLEQDARLVILLDRPDTRGELGVAACDMRAIVAKNEGEAGITIPLHFDGDFQRVSQHPTRPCATCGAIPEERTA